MRNEVCQLLRDALTSLVEEGVLPDSLEVDVQVERSRGPEHGDFASNLAMVLAKRAGLKPRDLAEQLCKALPASDLLSRAEVAGPGFINLFLSPGSYQSLPGEIRSRGAAYGTSDVGAGEKVMVEFVSANPTGPLHVGHGRGAAYGDALARVLRAAGYDAISEYYINDAGRQMDILALSVWLRYLELCGETVLFPRAAYQGDYIFDIAATLHREDDDRYRTEAQPLFADVAKRAAQIVAASALRGPLSARGRTSAARRPSPRPRRRPWPRARRRRSRASEASSEGGPWGNWGDAIFHGSSSETEESSRSIARQTQN